MVFRQLTVIAILVIVWTTGSTRSLAQVAGLSALTQQNGQEQSADDQRGSIDPTQDRQEEVVGSTAEDVREVFQELRGTQRQRKNLDMSVENLNERRRSRRRRSRQNPPPPVHVQLQPKFEFSRLVSAQVASGVQTRLNQLLEIRSAGSVSVKIENRIATLSGTVRSEYERGLLEKLTKIEPGISRVENQIAIEVLPLKPVP